MASANALAFFIALVAAAVTCAASSQASCSAEGNGMKHPTPRGSALVQAHYLVGKVNPDTVNPIGKVNPDTVNPTFSVEVAVGSASVRGFAFTYKADYGKGQDKSPHKIKWALAKDREKMTHKIKWALAKDGEKMTAYKVSRLRTPCAGHAVISKGDEKIHEQFLKCELTAGVLYRFWVVYEDVGPKLVMATPDGIVVKPQENRDCAGVWSRCNGDCIQTYTITQESSGDGAGCEIGDEEKRECKPGTDLCPTQENRDCDGVWSSCNRDCIKTFRIMLQPSGNGARCPQELECEPGEGLCPK